MNRQEAVEIRNEALDKAVKAFLLVEVPAWKVRDNVIDAADRTFSMAVAPARSVLREATEKVWDDFNDAVKERK